MSNEFTIDKVRQRVREHITLFKYDVTVDQEEEITTLYELNHEDYRNDTLALHIESCIQRMAETPDSSWKEQRRPSVCAKSIPPESFTVPSFPKNQEIRDFLMSRLGSNIPFCLLSDEQKQALVNSMYPLEVQEGVTLIMEGDFGAEMYIVEYGKFNVTIDGKYINTMCAGVVFGELALLHGIPRTATVTAIKKSKVWSAEQTSFSSIRIRDQVYRENLATEAIEENSFFRDMFGTLEDAQKALDAASNKFVPAYNTYSVSKNEVVIVLKTARITDDCEREVHPKDLLHRSFYTNTNLECIVLSLDTK
ncbi:cAMP-dependent protein kinase type I-alpha regulatory subunit [Glugoides intestinalis]